jgi:hypothetical protein
VREGTVQRNAPRPPTPSWPTSSTAGRGQHSFKKEEDEAYEEEDDGDPWENEAYTYVEGRIKR